MDSTNMTNVYQVLQRASACTQPPVSYGRTLRGSLNRCSVWRATTIDATARSALPANLRMLAFTRRDVRLDELALSAEGGLAMRVLRGQRTGWGHAPGTRERLADNDE